MKNNPTFPLNVLHIKEMEIGPSYISKINSYCEKQIIFLMISNKESWHYLAVKKFSASSKGITSKHDGDFYCLNCHLNCLNFYSHEKVCKNKNI